MFEFEVNDAVIVEQQKALEAALSTNPKTEAVLRKIIRKYVLEARKEVVQDITFKHGDPRGARQAVKTSVYKKVLGANINILNGRKAHGTNSYEPPRKLRPGQRGGNRVKRHSLDRGKYAPIDRGFVLRWINEGTGDRAIHSMGGASLRSGSVSIIKTRTLGGNRGSIAARNFFRPLGDRALGVMRDNLERAIEAELAALLPQDK